MPQSKTKRKKSQSNASKAERRPDWGGSAGKGTRSTNIAIGALAVLFIGGGVLYWVVSQAHESEFLDLAAQGQSGLNAVETFPDRGQRHLAPGEFYVYEEAIPTSGPHDPTWIEPGFYKTAQPPTRLVHALEHGSVVIYYDTPGDDVMATIEEWVELYPDRWEGVVATPMPGLGDRVVLSAWTKALTLDPFEPAVAAAFVDAYRGRGPENPMR